MSGPPAIIGNAFESRIFAIRGQPLELDFLFFRRDVWFGLGRKRRKQRTGFAATHQIQLSDQQPRRKVMSFLADRAFQDRFASALNAHPVFSEQAQWFDGSVLLEVGTDLLWLKIYKGKVIDHQPSVFLSATHSNSQAAKPHGSFSPAVKGCGRTLFIPASATSRTTVAFDRRHDARRN